MISFGIGLVAGVIAGAMATTYLYQCRRGGFHDLDGLDTEDEEYTDDEPEYRTERRPFEPW